MDVPIYGLPKKNGAGGAATYCPPGALNPANLEGYINQANAAVQSLLSTRQKTAPMELLNVYRQQLCVLTGQTFVEVSAAATTAGSSTMENGKTTISTYIPNTG